MGGYYEQKAAVFLEKQGLFILEKNFRCKFGEIDLIAGDGKYLVFVEVKYRNSGGCGWASAAVDWRKQRTVSAIAEFYLLKRGYGLDIPCRFDVVAIDGEHIQWIQNAFDHRR